MDIDVITGMLGGAKADSIQKHGEKWEQDRLRATLPAQIIRQQLEYAIASLLGKSKRNKTSPRRLVVLIDDLDRCEPRAAYKLLEGIKIYLNLKNCIFVLGMNQRVIEQAVAENLKMEKSLDGSDSALATLRAREYLEKICQELWHLPAIGEPHEYLRKSLDGYDRADHLAKVAAETNCLPPNPRKIKTIANVLRRFSYDNKAA
ncbi:MAG: P-loop NTPase fold protein, partial [Planctomycetota bacterium]